MSFLNHFLHSIKPFIFAILFVLIAPLFAEEDRSHYVLVSVAPHKFFVEKIAGDTVKVGLMVPAGASAHTFEPTPKQMIAASQADLWFYIGEGFESRAMASLKGHHPSLELVDLRQNLDLITSENGHSCCCHSSCQDLHFWLSPSSAKIQTETIAEGLIKVYPEHAALYRSRLKMFHRELEDLDLQIQAILSVPHNSSILVSHPAYAYFCRDYHFTQYSIEFEGRDPTSQQLTKLLKLAKDARIQKVFIQKQYSDKGPRLISQHLGAEIVMLDPYSENYRESLLQIAKAFASQSP